MDSLGPRIVRRFLAGDVVPFKPKPGAPVEVIRGRKYVLSTDGGPLGDQDEPGWLGGGGGARVIETPRSGSKWRFLWAYDTEKKYVAMWRVTDGNEKEGGSDKHYAAKIVQLEKKGQLNRVTHSEFVTIEREMRRREDAVMDALEIAIEQTKTDFQRTVDKLAQDYFEKNVAPKIDQAVKGVQEGAIPLGFEPFGPGVKDEAIRLRQAITYTISQILKRDLSEAKVEQYVKQRGVDLSQGDSQAVYWAVGDLRDMAYERFAP